MTSMRIKLGGKVRGHPLRSSSIVFIAITSVVACDLSATNPGPVPDAELDKPGAHSAIVQGVSLVLSQALAEVAYVGADATLEIVKAGRNHPVKLPTRSGQIVREDLSDRYYDRAQKARWAAEAAVDRFREVLGAEEFSTSGLVARALLYAGYTNRLLGENMCHAVINRGQAGAHTVHSARAEEFFTEAIAVAADAGETEVRLAALAGRASVRAYLDDWTGAASDAGQVPDDFSFDALYSAAQEDQFNFLFEINNPPWRTLTVFGTYYEDYYPETGDPRVRWGVLPEYPVAEFEDFPWYRPLKYTSREDPITLSSGREMRLTQAEARLTVGDWPGAMNIINNLRAATVSDSTGAPLPAWTASNAAEAWTHLKRERGIELWLEGRRLGDARRWIAEGVPGEMEDLRNRIRLCIPISENERRSNPNIPLDLEDPVNPIHDPSIPKPDW